jgi:glycosyltransferase involved in cell wall biosynthesis
MTAICFVVQSVYDFDPRVRRKAEALVAAGYSVDVLSLRAANGLKTYTLEGVNVRTIRLGKKRRSLARYLFEYVAFFLWAMARVPVQMRRRHYAIVDVNTLPDFLVFAPFLARWMGAKIVLDMHEITPEFYMSKYGIQERGWTIRALKYIEKLSLDFADHVLAVNEPIKDLFVRRGLPASKATVIMNAVDEARFAASSGAPMAAEGQDPGQFVMIYHGTLTAIYGLDLAIEAFALVHEQMPGSEMWILGSGPEAGRLKELAILRQLGAKLKLLGQVPPSEIPQWLGRADVGVLPIRRDVFLDFAFPNKLPEFIVAGKAVIVSKLRAISCYFTDQAVAYAEPNDPGALAVQMLRLYHDRALGRRLAERARAEYAPIRWEVMKRRYLTVVESLAGRCVDVGRSDTAYLKSDW